MGSDRRVIDSDENEAKVDATDEALQVKCSPVVLETGGADEGTFTRGEVHEYPVNSLNSVAVSTKTSTNVISYAVTTGRTLHITDIYLADFTTDSPGVEFIAYMTVAGSVKWRGRVQAGDYGHVSLAGRIQATTAQAILVIVRQWSGASKTIAGNLIGFETVDAEI